MEHINTYGDPSPVEGLIFYNAGSLYDFLNESKTKERGDRGLVAHLSGDYLLSIVGDITQELPVEDKSQDTIIAQHLLEHCIDTVGCLKMWARKLKDDGVLIICVPNEYVVSSIPLNPEHLHAFVPESLNNLAKLVGLKCLHMKDDYNGISFTSVFGKNGIS